MNNARRWTSFAAVIVVFGGTAALASPAQAADAEVFLECSYSEVTGAAQDACAGYSYAVISDYEDVGDGCEFTVTCY